MEEGVSVIICCYNSRERIVKTLEHLTRQITAVQWEIIVVDNASSDDTALVVRNFWSLANTNVPLKIVFQSLPGLIMARLKGIEEAKFDILLFCDDDNWLSPSYIDLAFSTIVANKSIGVLGGLGEEIADVPFPSWFYEIKQGYAVGCQGIHDFGLVDSNAVYGAGMLIRKSAFKKISKMGLEFLLSGRKGIQIKSGDDTELCYLIKLSGFEIWHDTRLTFKHYITENRINVEYAKKLSRSFGEAKYVHSLYEHVFKGTFKKKPLWLKEIVHSFYYILVLPFVFNKKTSLKFMFDLEYVLGYTRLLLKNRSRYDRQFKQLFDFLIKKDAS